MNNTTELKQLEESIERATVMVEMSKALERLSNNKDFKSVISKGYFEKESVRLVMLKADANMQSVGSQESIVKQIDAIGALSQYLRTISYLGLQAERSIAADTESIDELLTEGAE